MGADTDREHVTAELVRDGPHRPVEVRMRQAGKRAWDDRQTENEELRDTFDGRNVAQRSARQASKEQYRYNERGNESGIDARDAPGQITLQRS